MNNKGLKVILAIVLAMLLTAIGMMLYVVNTYYFKVNIVPVNTVEEVNSKQEKETTEKPGSVPDKEDIKEESVEKEKPKSKENKKESVEEEKPEQETVAENEQTSVSHSYLFEERQDDARGLLSQSQDELETQFNEAESFINNPAYSKYFISYLPSDWHMYVIDCLNYSDGSTEYWYAYDNTDVVTYLLRSSPNAEFEYMGFNNRYGSDFSIVYFENGVPSNSQQIYELMNSNEVPISNYTTDYKEGDFDISFYGLSDDEESYEEILVQ